MKKLLSFILAVTFVLAVAGCGEKSTTKDNSATDKTEEKIETEKTENCEIEVLKCIFADQIFGQDLERTGSGFPKSEGRVYVDLALKIKNTGEETFTKDSISAYFMYQDRRYDMQFEIEAASLTSISSNNEILPNETAIVHMLTKVESAIKEEDITVIYTVDEKNFEAKVATENITDPLEAKTKVKVGDKVTADNLYSFEVISCQVKEHLMASDTENSQIYKPFGGSDLQMIDLVLKIKNNTKLDLTNVHVYTIVNDEVEVGSTYKETKENTALEDISSANLTAGEEELCHLYTAVNKSVDVGELLVRFNLGGVCYYCEIEE